MPLIEWSEKFSVGHSEIDTQHRKWIEIHNSLHRSLIGGKSDDVKDATTATLESMRDYAIKHFSFEEEYLAAIGFPETDKHKNIHRDFEGMVGNYLDDIKGGRVILNTEIMKVLKHWLETHILSEDMKYGQFAADS